MSAACASEKLPLFAHVSNDEKNAKNDKLYDSPSNLSNEFSKTKTIFSKSEDNAKSVLVPNDENDYTNQKYCLCNSYFLTQKSTVSRKREAGNVLIESVKRRDNLKNINFEHNKTYSWKLIDDCNVVPESEKSSYKFENEKNAARSMEFDAKSLQIDLISTKAFNSTVINQNNSVNESENFTSDLSPSKLPCSSQNNDTKDLMEIDVAIETPDQSNLNETDTSCCNVSSSESSVTSEKSSAAINKDLNSLHLTDESVLLDNQANQSAVKSPFIPSLFSGVSSAIYFATSEEKVTPMPSDIRRLMNWKLSTITPVLIREMVSKSGFALVQGDNEEWVGTWGKHMKCTTFKQVKNFQKVNHYPGSFHLGRKDKLWDNYRKMRARHGSDAFNFFPDTYILPADMKSLSQTWDHDSFDTFWIIKPPASARGTGIKVIHKWSEVPKTKDVVVQRYISDPYLINGTKFDLRVYVLVPSIEPLRIYIFDDGLVRFASEKYTLSTQTFSNRYMHLTNYSINRKSSSYTSNDDGNACQGHKWTLKSFWSYMSQNKIDVEKIKESITDMVIKTIICAEGPICRLMKTYAKSTYNCFELFGFDIMLDKNLRPWLLEVNISPSLHTRTLLDTSVKCKLVKDMFNVACYQIPEIKKQFGTDLSDIDYGISSPVAHKHKALRNRFLSSEEKNKHSVFTFEHSNEKHDILEKLTPDDLRCLVENEDEFHRKGSFIKVFPSETTSKYFTYFEHIRYYNLLLDAWEKKYSKDKQTGIALLQRLCEKKFHLQSAFRSSLKKYNNDSNHSNTDIKSSLSRKT